MPLSHLFISKKETLQNSPVITACMLACIHTWEPQASAAHITLQPVIFSCKTSGSQPWFMKQRCPPPPFSPSRRRWLGIGSGSVGRGEKKVSGVSHNLMESYPADQGQDMFRWCRWLGRWEGVSTYLCEGMFESRRVAKRDAREGGVSLRAVKRPVLTSILGLLSMFRGI